MRKSLSGYTRSRYSGLKLEAFCRQFGASTLAEIHANLSNKDNIGACIQQARLFSHPQGQDINGVIFLQNTNPLIKVGAF